ncbi:MAG: tetratricopeptide repeat protein, partial [Planctomycetaceae bacterium]|nr:tetratricopeptide repeat protein [Planctomycetaceae bacterium]
MKVNGGENRAARYSKFTLASICSFRYTPLMYRLRFTLIFALVLLPFAGCKLAHSFRSLTPGTIRSGELNRQGNTAMVQGKWEEAEKKLEEAIKINKKDAELRLSYAEALWNLGKHQESLKQLNEALKYDENEAIHLSAAEKELAVGNLKSALRHAEFVVRFAPDNYKGWAICGKARRMSAEMLPKDNENSEKYRQLLEQVKNDYYRCLYCPSAASPSV